MLQKIVMANHALLHYPSETSLHTVPVSKAEQPNSPSTSDKGAPWKWLAGSRSQLKYRNPPERTRLANRSSKKLRRLAAKEILTHWYNVTSVPEGYLHAKSIGIYRLSTKSRGHHADQKKDRFGS